MDDIHHLYHNDFGIAFQWKKDALREDSSKKIQLIFRDTGFYLEPEEILLFSKQIKSAKRMHSCENCDSTPSCRNILLSTPSKHIDLAVSKNELTMIDDLIKGTLFQINLNGFLNKICTK
ncbi:hypothetical protein GTQ40_08590 [Flavobacteriaceae bacterium R38]|nr:hypothetical protein [Flavobacteriaceae bacterium R38]